VITTSGVEIPTADVASLHDSSADQLLKEVNEKSSKLAWAKAIWVVWAVAIFLALVFESPIWLTGSMVAVAFLSWPYWHHRDKIRKTVCVHFQFDEDHRHSYAGLLEAFQSLARSERVWHVVTQALADPKYNAGAGTLMDKKTVAVTRRPPPFFETNVEVWRLALGPQTFYFFPDRVLVFQRGRVGAVAYPNINVTSEKTRFVEQSGVPRDSTVIGKTWKYTNRSGGPDRRFAHNPTLPVVLYSQINLRSTTGVNVYLHVSNPAASQRFVEGFAEYARYISLLSTQDQRAAAQGAPDRPSTDPTGYAETVAFLVNTVGDTVALVCDSAKIGLKELNQRNEDIDICFQQDVQKLIAYFSAEEGCPSRRAAALLLELLKKLHPAQYGDWTDETALLHISNAVAMDRDYYLGSIKAPVTFQILSRCELPNKKDVLKLLSDWFVALAVVSASFEGRISAGKEAAISDFKSGLGAAAKLAA
jgi:hypothetical protein